VAQPAPGPRRQGAQELAHAGGVQSRGRRYRRRGPVDAGELPDTADDAPGPELALRRANVAATIDAAIAGLPERQRLALVLSHYEGCGNPEIAIALDVSVEAVESLLARARRGLKAVLADRWEELLDDMASL
jgi:RNA polymerase sigma-70 factor, ECF subfamily